MIDGFLCAERFFAGVWQRCDPCFRVECGGGLVVEDLESEDLADLFTKFFIVEGEADLYASIDIPIHPICGTEVVFFFSIVVKDEDAAVFEEAVDDAMEFDVIAEAGKFWEAAADAADEEGDLYAGCGGFIQPVYEDAFFEVVEFDDRGCGQSLAGIGDLAVEEGEEAGMEIELGYEQVLEGDLFAIAGIFAAAEEDE